MVDCPAPVAGPPAARSPGCCWWRCCRLQARYFTCCSASDRSDAKDCAARRAVQGVALVQVVPSGPGIDISGNLRILVDAVASACQRIVLTTPYFVPDPALALALQNAAMRGVEVTIILPAVNDSTLVTFASRAFFDELLAAGAQLLQFEGGLLHTKSVTIDDSFALFGTVNLDMRSLYLNFELMLAVYDSGFNTALLALQRSYACKAKALDAVAWKARPARERLLEGAATLVAPML
jgi:cardiolipin synthase